MAKKHDSIYLEIQRNIKTINKRYKIEKHVEICILNHVYEAHLSGYKIRVQDILLLEGIASQATLHAGIKTLEMKGLVTMIADPNDGRIKHILPTKLSLKRLNECETAIEKCCR